MLLTRSPHQVVVATLRTAHLEGSVGPTHASGWTCAWLNDAEHDEVVGLGFETYVWAGEGDTGVLLVTRVRGATPATLDLHHVEDAEQVEALGTSLTELLGPVESSGALRSLLSSAELDMDSLVSGLDDLLVLPELGGGAPQRCLVLTRGDPAMVRMAAAIAGPAWMLPPASGWNVTIPASHENTAAEELAAGVAAAVGRRQRTVLVWSQDTGVGLQIWRAGSMEAGWAWRSGWETVVSDPWELEAAVCDAIRPIQPDLHLPTLRALLRRTELDDNGLDRLADLLGLPSGLAETLRASAIPGDILGSELIEETTARSAVVGAMRSDWAQRTRRIRCRPLYIAYAVGTLLAALVCLAMTALGVAVLLTDGSAVDQAGVTTQDWVFVGIFALLTLVLAPTAVYRLKRVRASAHPPPADT